MDPLFTETGLFLALEGGEGSGKSTQAALLVEWLATGKGIGYGIISAFGRAKINEVWADVVVITVVSILLYNLVAVLESFVLARFGSDAGRSQN